MRTGATLSVTQADVDRLHALVKDRNAPPATLALLAAVIVEDG